MTNAKVVVSKEVAEAIKHFRNPDGWSWANASFMLEHFSIANVDCEYRIAIREMDTDELMSALVNGYEVEKSPEEKVRDYYDILKLREEYSEKSGVSGSQHRQGWQSVVETLDLLGIKIGGVNA